MVRKPKIPEIEGQAQGLVNPMRAQHIRQQINSSDFRCFDPEGQLRDWLGEVLRTLGEDMSLCRSEAGIEQIKQWLNEALDRYAEAE